MKSVLLIGSEGYIGSEVYGLLKILQARNFISDITRVDLGWYGIFSEDENLLKCDYNTLTKEKVQEFDIVILLAAFSSPAMSVNSGVVATVKENYDNFVGLVGKLREGQKFIYASSASLYSGLHDFAAEDAKILDPNNSYDLTKSQADNIMKLFPAIEYYSLRLGTVSGASFNFRVDTEYNSMVTAALEKGELQVFNGQVRRAFVSMVDLLNVFETIILSEKDLRGIYNIATFNWTMNELALNISEQTGAKLKVVSQEEVERALGSHLPPTYDFSIDTAKFQETYDFRFTGSIYATTMDIKNYLPTAIRSKRVEGKKYE